MRYEHDEAKSHPLLVEMGAGTYHWCRCGRTHTVPYCDGSHKGTSTTPLAFEIKEPGTKAICNCGLTANPPYCSGAHAELK